jgi:hypothetical protein
MLIVVASRADEEAGALASRWGSTIARVLQPHDLSVPGWRHYAHCAGASTAVVDGVPIAVGDITGVLTLMPAVIEAELDQISAEDRSYVAAEMHAFLFAWLSALRCPVMNRPDGGCLSGPPWTVERWTWEAHRAGFDTGPHESIEAAQLDAVTIVGDQVFPKAAVTGRLPVERLARQAGLETMSVMLSRGRFVCASARPHLTTPGVSEALLSRLSAGAS